MLQVVKDTDVEQFVDVPVLQFPEGVAEQTLDFTVLAIKGLVEEIQLLLEDCRDGSRGRLWISQCRQSRRSSRRLLHDGAGA